MIISYLFKKTELDKMADGFLVALEKLSFNIPYMFNIEEIEDIKKSTDKKIFLDLRPLYHEDEFNLIDDSLSKLSNLDGYLFSDLGLVSIFKKYGILDKAIYSPLTFNSTSYDLDFFKDASIGNIVLSSDLTKNRINEILNSKEDSIYSYIGFGFSQIFYSRRPHLTNYDKYYKVNNNLHNDFDVTMKEATRNDYYHIIEDDRSFRIYKDKIFNSIFDLDIKRFKYIFLDRLFIEDELYFDTVSLYEELISIEEYLNKYNRELFDNRTLFNEVGLLKEDSK